MKIPENKYLGSLCKRGHDWNGTGKSLRWKGNNNCVGCVGRHYQRKRGDYKVNICIVEGCNEPRHYYTSGVVPRCLKHHREYTREYRRQTTKRMKKYSFFWRQHSEKRISKKFVPVGELVQFKVLPVEPVKVEPPTIERWNELVKEAKRKER